MSDDKKEYWRWDENNWKAPDKDWKDAKVITAGVDVGSVSSQAVIMTDGELYAYANMRTGYNSPQSATDVMNWALAASDGLKLDGIHFVVGTGYGRVKVPFSNKAITEIACHARGGFAYVPKALTLVDIGGQDNEVVKIDDRGLRLDFKMNRKCAAGTGTFIEEIANRMNVPPESLDEMARKAEKRFKIGSYCTVFASTEILAQIRAGASAEELVRGIFESVVDRVMEMIPFEGLILLCGGVVEYHPFIADLFKERISGEVIVPPHPQLTGAYGAALFARESAG